LVAKVGADLPDAARQWLRGAGIDTEGVVATAWPTLRARQRLDAAGNRSQEWLAPGEVVAAQLRRTVGTLPARYRSARGFHIGLHPDEPDLGFLAALRALGGLVSVEPFRRAAEPPTPEALRALLEASDIFSPNLASAESLVGPGRPEELARRLAEAGGRVIALRMGRAGSLVYAPNGQGAYRVHAIPAVGVTIVDPVGAGNAYCGAFLTGWIETGDATEAGLRGAVAASFVLEQVGLPALDPGLRARARERRDALRHRAS
jgi:sugar/nucleoside kinase (ribokinase family)